MNRWKVESTDYGDFRLWFVFERARHGMWWCQRGEFNTHTEALAYADRMACTVKVTLPREPLPLALRGLREDAPVVVTQSPEGDCVFLTDEDDGEMVALYPFELRPLALALLALHYRNQP